MNSLDGPREAAIKSFQKQIDFHTGETRRLRYAQNSQLAISRLPAELLSGAFLYVVEAGLQNGDTNFAAGTFNFLQVCRRWNEVAVGFPGLWVWRISGAIKAWPLFKSRSKDAPLFLTWEPELPDSARELLTDTKTLKGIRRLNFSGTIEDLGNLLHAIGLGPLSNASAIRLKNDQYDSHEPPEHLTHFLSSPFPKLSKLDVKDFLPDFTSPMFTTSSLTTLKLCFSYDEISCTLSQFSQILQHHPNLRELDLHHDGIPQSESSEPLVPCVLPQLVYLRLYGTELAIKEFVEFIGMSSPLHNIVIRFQDTGYATISSLTKTIKKILAAYYGCPGLDYPRLADHLAISSYSRDVDDYLVFDARSDSTSTFRPMSNLKLQVHRVGNELVKKILPLFPLNHVRKFVDMTLALDADGWRGVLWKMENLSHLQLEKLNIESVLDVLYVEGQGVCVRTTEIAFGYSRKHRRIISAARP